MDVLKTMYYFKGEYKRREKERKIDFFFENF